MKKIIIKRKSYAGKGKTREILAHNIRQLRLKNNYTQVKLAKIVGVSAQAIKMFEWKKLYPSERTLERIASVFKTEVYILFKPKRGKLL